MRVVDEGVVIRKLDEWPRPNGFDGTNLSNDLLDRLQFIAPRQENRTGAELAFVGATAAGLHGNTIVFLRIQQIEARHGRFAQIEGTARGLSVERLESSALKILQQPGPKRLPFPDHH